MFKRKPLQSKSEVWMRNIAMGFLIIYMTIFLIIPVVIVIAGSFHQWNPLNQTYNWIGLDNYIRMFSYPTFWQSMGIPCSSVWSSSSSASHSDWPSPTR